MICDQCLEREGEKSRVRATILATFLIIILFLVLYIQPSCSKTKIRQLIRETLTGQVKRGNFLFFHLNTKRTQSNSEKTSIWSTLKLLRKKL